MDGESCLGIGPANERIERNKEKRGNVLSLRMPRSCWKTWVRLKLSFPKPKNTNSADSTASAESIKPIGRSRVWTALPPPNERHQFRGLFTEASEKPKVIVIGLLYTDTYGFLESPFRGKKDTTCYLKPMKSISLSSIWMIRQPVF